MYPGHAAAQQWHHANAAQHYGANGHMNGHTSWDTQQNGGMNNSGHRAVWHDGQALQMPPPGGWDASNHLLSECRFLALSCLTRR